MQRAGWIRAATQRGDRLERIGRALLLLASAATFLGLAGCKTAPPPPAPVPVEVTPPPSPTPAVFVKVTGSRLNVRDTPSAKGAIVARLRKGDRLQVLGEDGIWVKVLLPDSTSGWVSAQYVRKDQPCPPDKLTAEVLNEPPISLAEDGPHGRVVIDATVSAEGVVTATRLVQNTTGSTELAKRTADEVRQLRFSPPVRRCKPAPFIYTYTRTY